MAHTNVQLVSGNLTTGGDDPTFYIDRVNNKVGIGGVPVTSGDNSSNVLQITGSMLATNYHGDGSSLTGLNDSKWLEYSGDASKIYYNGGNVGIGLTDPGTALDVNGTVTATSFSGGESTVTGTNTLHNTTIYPLKVETVSSSSTPVEEGIGTGIEFRVERQDTDNIQGHCGAIRVYGAEGIPGTNDLWNMAFRVRDNDTQREPMTIKYNGNVGIGEDNPGSKLVVNGDIYATGDVTASSDRRLKTDIKRIENALDKVCAIGGYTYMMNDKPSTGLIAQEVLEVLPEVVHGSEETSYSLAYGNIIGLLVEAVKELKEKIG